jgi:NitT/TauT family transport system substrate-binding protein
MSAFMFSRTFAAAALLAALLTPSIAHAQTTLRVPVVSRTIFYLPAWTAEKQGFFKQEGLDVKIEVYDASEKIFHDLRAGTHQIGIASIESVVADSYQGGKIPSSLSSLPPLSVHAMAPALRWPL